MPSSEETSISVVGTTPKVRNKSIYNVLRYPAEQQIELREDKVPMERLEIVE